MRLAHDGADVALVDIVPDGINAVADEIAQIGSKATTFVADVSDRQQVFAAVEHAATALGGFEVMVNNAGIALGRPETPDDVAGFVAYLAGPDSDYMTGQAGLIDGGLVYR